MKKDMVMVSMANVYEIKYRNKAGKIVKTHTTAYWMKDAMDNLYDMRGYLDIISFKQCKRPYKTGR